MTIYHLRVCTTVGWSVGWSVSLVHQSVGCSGCRGCHGGCGHCYGGCLDAYESSLITHLDLLSEEIG